MKKKQDRIERDSMGTIRVPASALYGAQTQRAKENFTVSGRPMPPVFLHALGRIKAAAARANGTLGLLPKRTAAAIAAAAEEVAAGRWDDQFPVDVFQTGSGTSTNMNANEVIAALASRRLKRPVHPNDEVNRCQSSNDVIPSALRVSACLEIRHHLLPALKHLEATLRRKAEETRGVVKTGRTHLMDAVPLHMYREIGAWADRVSEARQRLETELRAFRRLPLGATAVGTGLNAHPRFAALAIRDLEERTGFPFRRARDPFAGISAQDGSAAVSGILRAAAVVIAKIAEDLRWMNSGPNAGLGEITLPALQPGSSIMPGKVNPVIPEAAAMACVQVFGYDAAVAAAARAGNFQLNTMLPLIAWNLLESTALLARAARLLADKAIAGFQVNRERIEEALGRNPVLATALNPLIGYDRAAAIAKRAFAQARPVLDVAREMTDLPESTLRRLLDPKRLARGGIPGRSPHS